MKRCEICEEEKGFLTCEKVGPVCFECWGSGIHEAMQRKADYLSIARDGHLVEEIERRPA